MLINFIVYVFAAYGFAVAVQIIRGHRLNIKPFNCRPCLSWWFILMIVIFLKPITIENLIVTPLAVAGCVYLLTQIEERLITFKDE